MVGEGGVVPPGSAWRREGGSPPSETGRVVPPGSAWRREGGSPPSETGRFYAVKLGERGSIQLPVAVRQALRLKPGDDVILTFEDSTGIRLTSRYEVARRCLGMLDQPADRELVAELVSERRQEAARR
jgi:bifunctional DNA-binding transcriptional regulator/antitoxin component of YhaV-PrlF toxin-antitoxin module